VIEKHVASRSHQIAHSLTHLLSIYYRVLAPPIRNNDSAELTKVCVHIRTHLCQNYTASSVTRKLSELNILIKSLADKGAITGDFIFPDIPRSPSTYEAYKVQIIPIKYFSKIKPKKHSADEEFYDTLSRTCSAEIAQRLKEHVYNFKHVKHHRNPLSTFLDSASAEHPNWYEHPKVIEGTLLKFRNNLLSKVSRNSAYGRYQNVKNAIKVLYHHNLISKDTDFPGNLRRCANTQKVRVKNPLLCATDIYDDREKELFRNTPEFIKKIATDIEYNLKVMLKEARKIVFEGYRKYADRERFISNSERSEFLKSPDLRITTKTARNKYIKRNPFSPYKSVGYRLENLVAYFDHFYECCIDGTAKHDLHGIIFSTKVQQYLGLTPHLASAMQIIIVEELGINPYSLYKVKVHSDGHGHEFIQVTDKGSVRLRTLKPRARHAKTRNAPGSLTDLSDTSEQDINAATCLKMALEMTQRARAFTNHKELWLCSYRGGVGTPRPETFQQEFIKIRTKAALISKTLNLATLKNIRSSKGVWIYLDSKGDSLKTAGYFGNTVMTTLHRYVPEYLTELVYRVKIRTFQNILLFMAVAHDESPADSLQLTSEDFIYQVKKAFDNPDMGGSLYESLKAQEREHDAAELKYFCVSIKNVTLALKYAIDGENQSLKEDCIAAITKISEGPIIMKQLLRQAQKKLKIIKEE